MSAPSRSAFVGRRALVAALLDAVRADEPRIVVGQPGVGKSRVLEYVAESVRAERGVHELVATRAVSAMPLGVFLPLAERVASVFETAAQIRLALARSRPLVIVDDAHLLDAPSAGLLLELARARVPMILSVREGAQVLDAIRSIERLPTADRVDIAPFTEPELAALLHSRLGADPDPGLVTTVLRRSGGVPLYVDELVRLLVQASRIGFESGTAYLMPGRTPSLSLPLEDRLDPAPVEAVRVARLVALADSLPEPIVRGLTSPTAIESAEKEGLVEVRGDDSGNQVVPRHPLIAESVLAAMPVGARLRLIGELSDAIEAAHPDPVLTAHAIRWRAELGREVDIDELLTAVSRIQAAAPSEADRLLDAAIGLDMAPPQRLRLAALLSHQHRLDDAESIVEQLVDDDLPVDLRRERDLVHSFLLMFPANEPGRAVELLRSSLGPRAGSDPPSPGSPEGQLLEAHLATALMQAGDIVGALRVGMPILAAETAPSAARAHAALTVSASLHYGAHGEDFDRVRRTRDRAIRAGTTMIPEGAESAALIDESMLIEHREALDAAETLARTSYDRALVSGNEGLRAQHAHQLARIAIERGAPQRALPLVVGATVADGLWALAFRAWISSTYIEALTLTGRIDDGEHIMERALRRRRSPLYDIDIARANAVLTAARGDLDGAGDALRMAGVRALNSGQITRGRYALEQAVRYHSDGAARALVNLGPGIGGDVMTRARRLARAWLDRNPAALEACARTLAARGLLWRALETAALAGSLRADKDSALLVSLRGRCPFLLSPVMPQPVVSRLTTRELDIAERAASGESDAQIAREAGISIRTVQTHLSNSYRKLGIGGRSQLSVVLARGRPPT